MAVKTVSWKRNREKRLDTARKLGRQQHLNLHFFSFRISPNTSVLSFLQFWLPYRFPMQQSKVFFNSYFAFYLESCRQVRLINYTLTLILELCLPC